LWRKYVETLVRVRPRAFVLENVPQFLTSNEFSSLQRETVSRGRLSDYELEPFLVNSADYGVGQARKRAVVIGRHKDMEPFGRPTPLKSPRPLSDVLREVEARVVAVDLPDSRVEVLGRTFPGAYKTPELHVTRRPTPRSVERYRHIPPGGNRHNLPDELSTPGWRRHKTGSGDVMGRLVWDKPSVTIRTEFFKPEKGRYLHPDEHRPITHYEAALIQGFPPQFVWCGSKSEIARQIGNAVPVGLAEAVGSHLAVHLDEFGS
jgi:DNA (cytosine-5)-methyltransferase 1